MRKNRHREAVGSNPTVGKQFFCVYKQLFNQKNLSLGVCKFPREQQERHLHIIDTYIFMYKKNLSAAVFELTT